MHFTLLSGFGDFSCVSAGSAEVFGFRGIFGDISVFSGYFSGTFDSASQAQDHAAFFVPNRIVLYKIYFLYILYADIYQNIQNGL